MGDYMKIQTFFITLIIYVLVSILAICGIIVGCSSNGTFDGIFVVRIDGKTNFSYALKNKRILMTGATNEFEVNKSKEEVFNGLAKSFSVFKQSDDRIQIIDQHEIFTVKYLDKNRFILYDETIYLNTNNGTFTVPFPTDQLAKKDEARFDTSFYIDCDINYLKRFYSHYENVVINDDKQSVMIKDARFSPNTNEDSSNKTVLLEIKEKEVLFSVYNNLD